MYNYYVHEHVHVLQTQIFTCTVAIGTIWTGIYIRNSFNVHAECNVGYNTWTIGRVTDKARDKAECFIGLETTL